MKLSAYLTIVMTCVVAGCSWQKPPTTEEPAGKYRGNYADQTVEKFHLLRDGSFTQELNIRGTIAYRNEGRWHVDGPSIVFDHFYRAFEQGTDRVSVPKVGTNNVRGLWITLGDRRSIVFDIDHRYAIESESASDVTTTKS